MEALRVCVADDCADETLVLCEGLEQNGFGAFGVHSGQAALEACRNEQVDLLLLDVGLPDIDGFEVCSRLKADDRTRGIPVIFVTARDERPDIERGYALGAIDYIPKPYNLPMVIVRVDRVLHGRPEQPPETFTTGDDVLHDVVYTDQLTGLRNRRFLLERLQEEVEKSGRYGYQVSCLAIDMDEVTALEQEWGTAALDDLLVEIAMAMRKSSRNFDILARFDNTVFTAVLPHAGLEEALGYIKKIRQEINPSTFSDPPTHAELTFSVVVCGDGNRCNADGMLGEAMRGLLHAKSLSGDRVYTRKLDPADAAS